MSNGLHPFSDSEYRALGSARSRMQTIYCELLLLAPQDNGIIWATPRQIADALRRPSKAIFRSLWYFQKSGLVYVQKHQEHLILFFWRWPYAGRFKAVQARIHQIKGIIGEEAAKPLEAAFTEWEKIAPHYKRTFREPIPPMVKAQELKEAQLPEPWIVELYENVWGQTYRPEDEETTRSFLVLQGYGEMKCARAFQTAASCAQKDLGFVQTLIEGMLSEGPSATPSEVPAPPSE